MTGIYPKFEKFFILKFLFILFLCLLPVILVRAQDNKNDTTQYSLNKGGDFIIEISPNISTNNIAGSRFAGGANFEYFVSRRVNFNAYLFIGNGFGHLNLSVITLPIFILFMNQNSTSEIENLEDLVIKILLILTVFENPSIHFPVSSSSDFSLNTSPLRIKWDEKTKSVSKDENVQLAFAAGIRYNKYFGRFVLSPYGEFSFGYSDFTPEINTGIHFGLFIPGK
jgi:hypothetical protein